MEIAPKDNLEQDTGNEIDPLRAELNEINERELVGNISQNDLKRKHELEEKIAQIEQ